MNNDVKICKGCGKEILEGKYCKMCKAERKEKRDKAGKIALEVLGSTLSLVLMVVPKVLGKKK